VEASNHTTVFLLLVSCQFRSNSAVSGAALLLDSGLILHSDSSVSDCLFAYQVCEYGAVALAQAGGFLSFSNCVFQGNKGLHAAAVFIETEDPAVTTFTNGQFLGSVGPITFLEANSRFNSSFITRKCKFIDNEGSDMVMEGGFWQDFSGTFVYSTVSEFIFSGQALASLSNTSMSNNYAEYLGGCMHLFTGATLHCENCAFLNNSSGHSGGVIYSEQDSTLIIRNSLFRFNSASQFGGVLQMATSIAVTSLIESCLFELNSVGNAGLIVAGSSSLILSNVTVRNNQGTNTPGIMLMLSTLLVLNSRFSAHAGTQSAFLVGLTGSIMTIVGSRFWDGDSKDGGSIYISSSVLNVVDSEFHSLQGGAIFANDNCSVTLRGVKMTNISLETDGSLIDILYSNLHILHSDFSDFQETGIYGFALKEVTITGSSFTNGLGKMGAALQCYECQQVLLDRSIFADLQANTAGAVYVWAQDVDFRGELRVSKSNFSRNAANTGGAVAVFNYKVWITGSGFDGNRAREGAGLWLDCLVVDMCGFSISDSDFWNNSAVVKGGGVAWTTVKPLLANLTFSDNSAQYGQNVASYPMQIVLDSVQGRSLLPVLISDYPPGQATPVILTASIVDHYGQVYTIDNSSTAALGAINTFSSVLGTFKVSAVQGTFLLDAFTVYGPPGTTQNITLSSSAITADLPGDPDAHISSVIISVDLRKCVPGETETAYSCDTCSIGTYSFDPSTPCQICLSNAKCWGNLTVTPNAGYWRSSQFSPVIRACPKAATCQGGEVEGQPLNLTGYCLEGYESNLCQTCKLHYSRTGKNTCSKCPDSELNAVRLLFIAIALVLVLAIMVWSTLRASTRPKAEYSILIKIMTNYLQLVTLVVGFKLRWPQKVEDAFTAQNSVGGTSEQFFSFDCLIGSHVSQEQTYYRKMIIMAVMPLLLIAVSLFFWTFLAWRKKKWVFLTRECAATIVIIFFLILPNLVDSMFSLFSCQEIEAGEYWLTIDLSIKCWNGKHTLYLLAVGIPGVVVWVFGVPLGCVGVLIKYRRRQDELWLKMQYGFLISGYTRHCFYWEFVILYRKILIIICAVFINNSIQLQALTIQVVLLVAFFLQLQIQPYTTPQLNTTETLAIMVADITIYSGLYYLTLELSIGASWLLFIFIVAANITFILYWLYALIRSAWDPITTTIPILRRILRPNYFRDKEIERLLELSENSPHLFAFPTTLSLCMRAILRDTLPSRFLRPAKHYAPRFSVVSVNTTSKLPRLSEE